MIRLAIHGVFRAIDAQGRELPIKSKKARALLAYLALPPGKARSRETIAALLWSDRGEEQARSSLRQALSGLRKELGTEADLALRISDEAVALDPAHVIVDPPDGDVELLEGLHVNDPAFDDWLRDERQRQLDAGMPQAVIPGAARQAGKPAIVVGPFANLSDDPDQQYFSDGITEDITTELSRFKSIDVLARQSVFTLRDQVENLHQLAQRLGADYLLEGSIRRAGNRIRLTAQLIDIRSNKQVWANRYDRELTDVFALQDELARAIVAALVGRLEAEGVERVQRKPAESLAAYDLYLQGLMYGRKYDENGIIAAKQALEKAVALDPGFARAHGLLALMTIFYNWFLSLGNIPADEVLDLVRRSVELDPTDSDCFAKLGAVYISRGEHEQARRNLDIALQMNPHDCYTWTFYAWYLVTVGQPSEALDYLDRILAVDPHPPNWNWDVRAEALVGLGRFAEAIDVLNSKPRLYFYNLGQMASCCGHLGRIDDARELWARAIGINSHLKPAAIGEDMLYLHREDTERWHEGLRKAGLWA